MADDKNGRYYSFSIDEGERFLRVLHQVAVAYIKKKYSEEHTLSFKVTNQGRRSNAGAENGMWNVGKNEYGEKIATFVTKSGKMSFKYDSIRRCEERFLEYKTLQYFQKTFFINNYEGNFELNVSTGVPEGYLAVYNLFMHEFAHVLDDFNGTYTKKYHWRSNRWIGTPHGPTFVKAYRDIMERLPFDLLWPLMGV